MASTQTSPLSVRQIQQTLQRAAKETLVESGLRPATRRSKKELDLAVQRLAQQPYSTLNDATQAGQSLGQKIVERSQARGKTELDAGIIRQLMLTGDIPTVAKVAPAKPAKPAPAVAPPIEAVEEPAPLPEVEPEVEVVEAMEAVKGVETVDPSIEEAPAMAEIETLDPAAIDAPAPEPVTSADVAAVETTQAATP